MSEVRRGDKYCAWDMLRDKGLLDTRNPEYIMLSTEAKEISEDLGKLICWSKQYNMLENLSVYDDERATFLHELSESFWNESVINYKDEDLEIAFLSIKHIGVMPHVLIDILIKLIDELNFSSIRIIEKVNRDVFTNSKLGMVFDLFMRIICGNIENYDKYKRKEIYDQIQDLKLPQGDFEHELYYYSTQLSQQIFPNKA